MQRAVAREISTSPVKNVSASGAKSSPAPQATYSPPHREFGLGGEKIERLANEAALAVGMAALPQGVARSVVAIEGELLPPTPPRGEEAAFFHHEGPTGGEKIVQHGDLLIIPGETPPDSLIVPRQEVRRGRPREIDDEMKTRIISLMSVGLSLRQTAAKLGLHHTSIMSAMRREKLFAEQVVAARSEAVAQPLAVVIKAARGNWRAAAWLTKFLQDRFYKAEQPLEERTLQEREK